MLPNLFHYPSGIRREWDGRRRGGAGGCPVLFVQRCKVKNRPRMSCFLMAVCVLCVVFQGATVTPFCASTCSTLGMSGGPGGISRCTAVNIWVARPPWPVNSSISPPPTP